MTSPAPESPVVPEGPAPDVEEPMQEEGEKYDGGDIPAAPDTRPPEERSSEQE
jgi:hypothetical protein